MDEGGWEAAPAGGLSRTSHHGLGSSLPRAAGVGAWNFESTLMETGASQHPFQQQTSPCYVGFRWNSPNTLPRRGLLCWYMSHLQPLLPFSSYLMVGQ